MLGWDISVEDKCRFIGLPAYKKEKAASSLLPHTCLACYLAAVLLCGHKLCFVCACRGQTRLHCLKASCWFSMGWLWCSPCCHSTKNCSCTTSRLLHSSTRYGSTVCLSGWHKLKPTPSIDKHSVSFHIPVFFCCFRHKEAQWSLTEDNSPLIVRRAKVLDAVQTETDPHFIL